MQSGIKGNVCFENINSIKPGYDLIERIKIKTTEIPKLYGNSIFDGY